MLSKVSSVFAAVFVVGCLISPPGLYAADDPSIQGKLRTDIQSSMRQYIDDRSADGVYLHYDAAKGELLKLKYKELHSGIVKKGDFYVSCADFTAPSGKLIDLDFLVRPADGKLQTTQAIVHAVDGQKRPYHLESE